MLDAILRRRSIIGAADWQPAMPELLARLGTATQVSRAFLFGFIQRSAVPAWLNPAASCGPPRGASAERRSSRLQNVPIPTAEDNWRIPSPGQVRMVKLTRSQTRADARALFDETGTLSLLSVPIMVNGVIWGAIGFDDCQSERIWDDVESTFWKSATALIAEAIARSRAEGRLRERDNQLIEAQRIASVGSWVLDFATDQVSWSDEGLRIFGLSPKLEAGLAENLQRIHPDDRERVAAADAASLARGGQFEIEYPDCSARRRDPHRL